MTSDGETLFRVICEQPWEDTPRLMYADWLEENDQPERAEFIRLQCASHALQPEYLCEEDRTRMTQLLHEHGKVWREELPILPGVHWNALFARGFIEFAEVHAHSDLGDQLAQVFASAPLVRLVVQNLNEERLLALLECPFLGRLTTLAMLDLHASRLSTAANEKLTQTARRHEYTRFIYHRD